MKYLRIFLLITGISLAILVFYFGYCILSISSTFNPLKEYNYPITKSQFEKSLHDLENSDYKITYKGKDITGSKEDGLKYYFTLVLKKSYAQEYEYNLNYEEKKDWKNSIALKLNLVGVHDNLRKTGGYKKEDKDVSYLIKIFETEILPRINK